MQTERKDIFWKVAVVVLFVFVLVQSTILYFVLFRPENSKQVRMEEQADAVIVPRTNTVQQNTMPMNSGNYMRQRQQAQLGGTSKSGSTNNTSGNACVNMLPPLPQISPQQPQASCTSPVISSNLSSTCPGGICNTTITTSRNANINGMMQAMMNDPFFDNNSFFGNVDEEFARMSQLMDAMFSGGMSSNFPSSTFSRGATSTSYQLKDDGKNYIFEMKISGLDKSDVKAEVNQDILTISGTQKQEVRNNTQYGNSYSSSYSSFQNSFRLPGKVDNKNIKVSYDNKMLKVILPKV